MHRKKLVVYGLSMVILVMAAAFPVFAQGNANNGKEPVGTRINLFDGDQVVSGPFHVQHGYCMPSHIGPEGSARGKTSFRLEINGEEQEGRYFVERNDDTQCRWSLFNYPGGLPSGEYQFKGIWDEPCFYFHDDCAKKNALADPPYVEEITVTVP